MIEASLPFLSYDELEFKDPVYSNDWIMPHAMLSATNDIEWTHLLPTYDARFYQTQTRMPEPVNATIQLKADYVLTPPMETQSLYLSSPVSLNECLKDTPPPSPVVRKERKLSKIQPTTVPNGRFWKTIKIDGRTRYMCPHDGCDKSYTRPHNLKSHYLSHTGELPFSCSVCRRKFARRSDMVRHESNMHKA